MQYEVNGLKSLLMNSTEFRKLDDEEFNKYLQEYKEMNLSHEQYYQEAGRKYPMPPFLRTAGSGSESATHIMS